MNNPLTGTGSGKFFDQEDLIDRRELMVALHNLPTWTCQSEVTGEDIEAMDARKVRHLVENFPAIDPWIPAEKRLPEPMEDVLAAHKNGQLCIEFLLDDRRWIYKSVFGPVTHWMPLPKHPEKEAEAEMLEGGDQT